MKHVTIRNLPPQVAEGLEKEKRQRGQSLNQTVIRSYSGAPFNR